MARPRPPYINDLEYIRAWKIEADKFTATLLYPDGRARVVDLTNCRPLPNEQPGEQQP